MITFIHGDDTASSRNFFLSEKENSVNPLFFEGDKVTMSEIVQIFEGNSLFFEEKNVFIENFFSKRKPGKELEELITFFKEIDSKNNVYFWEGKEVTKKYLNLFSKAFIKTFKIPQSIFVFLDSLKPDNQTNLIGLFHKTLLTNEPEMILFMITRQFRLLLALNDAKSSENISEIKNMAPWQLGKLKKQSSFFKSFELTAAYQKLYKIDLEQKTGKSSLSLVQSLDFFLLGL
ncbi:MAG: hypothetical protein Q7R53_01395 [bacterium]|nr:hypothetical protein [bacterium]